MGKVINFPVQVHLYGGCPHCRKHDGYTNIGKEYWFVCLKHKVKWRLADQNCLRVDNYLDETQEDWDRNREIIEDYQEVEPIYWKPNKAVN